jgi:hypothetical protein
MRQVLAYFPRVRKDDEECTKKLILEFSEKKRQSRADVSIFNSEKKGLQAVEKGHQSDCAFSVSLAAASL